MTLQVQQLRFSYDGMHDVIRNVSARAQAGRVTAIIGPNAAGKTTLVRLVAGLLEPAAGSVTLNDRALDEVNIEARAASLAYVAQRPRVDAPFPVRDVVAFGRFSLSPDRNAIREAMTACALEHLADTPYPQLSVGQQQRVSLARAMAQLGGGGAGKAIVLDEPMSAMDPRHVMATARQLRQMAKMGTAVLVVLHDLPTAVRLADDVWVLNQGEIAAAGPIRETLTPERLEEIFSVPFIEAEGQNGASIPLAAWPGENEGSGK